MSVNSVFSSDSIVAAPVKVKLIIRSWFSEGLLQIRDLQEDILLRKIAPA